jgi:LDH2 family malate/lactate/ureidoglycolate dehydrogenase
MSDDARLSERTHGQWWQSTEPMVQADYEAVRQLGLSALIRAGASVADASFLLSLALDKSVQGDHARGLSLFPGMVRAAMRGDLSLRAEPTILRETPGTALIDADARAAKPLVSRAAMDLAIAKARQTGIGWVSARVPATILTAHLKQAVDAGMIGMVMTQSYPMVAPVGGFKPLMGNGPIGFGIPAGERDPIFFDASLTQTSSSGVRLAAAQGQQVAEGLLLNERGEPTTDARDYIPPSPDGHDAAMVAKGTLLPLGGSHKATGLIFIITLLTALLADSDVPWDAGDVSRGSPLDSSKHFGSTYMALDPGAFLPIAEFRRRVDAFIDDYKASPRKAGVDEIVYPGERSQRLKRERQAAGRFLMPRSHYDVLNALGEELGLNEQLPPVTAAG